LLAILATCFGDDGFNEGDIELRLKLDPLANRELYDALFFLGVVQNKRTGRLTVFSRRQIRKWLYTTKSLDFNGRCLIRDGGRYRVAAIEEVAW
jgi:hypothetical protein